MQLSRRALLSTVMATGFAGCAGAPVIGGPRRGKAAPDATEMASLVRSGKASAAELVEEAIKRSEALQPKLNFLVTPMYDLARAKTKAQLSGPFAGVPTLIKDLNGAIGAPTRWGSRSTAGAPIETRQNAWVDAYLGTGMVCIGKSQAPEGGYLPTTEPLAFGACRNPWDTTRSTGGSSGGAACAVAAGVVPIAHANDGGGSNRFPAANCGILGLKPSRGRLIDPNPGARPLDIAVQGCVSVSVRDTAGLIAATEAKGAGAVYPPVGLVERASGKKLKIGFLTKGHAGHDADPEVRDIILANAKSLVAEGHEVTETAWPFPTSFTDDFLAFWSLGAKNDFDRTAARLGRKPDDTLLEPFSLRMAENALKLSPADIQAVQARLLDAAAAYDKWAAGFDAVMSPVFASPPSPLGYLRGDVPFEELVERLKKQCGYTLIHNVSGAAAISVPLGWTKSGLPVGVQFGGVKGGERTLLELAYALEEKHPWAGKRPGVYAG